MFTVTVTPYSLSPGQIGEASGEPVFTSIHKAPKAAARVLIAMIHGKSDLARAVGAKRFVPMGFGARYVVTADGTDYALNAFREKFCQTTFDPAPKVSGKYGAPMGRMSHNSCIDGSGRSYELTVNENAPPMRLVRVPLDSGGYDRGGAYWGAPSNLYYYQAHLTDIDGYVRGNTREQAKEAVRKIHPLARFYR